MRFTNRLILSLLGAMLLFACARAEEIVSSPVPGTVPETRIAPQHQPPEYVEWILETARGELGYTEERSGVTKYGTWTGEPEAEWCAEFLCWCVDQVDKKYDADLLHQIYPYYTGTNVGRDWFIKQGRYIARIGNIPGWGTQWFRGNKELMGKNSYIPLPGDWVFFSTNASGDTTHVAMVEYCAYDENGRVMVHVIEGNNPESVARNAYPINYWGILGYGTVYDLADMTLRFGNEGSKVSALQTELVAAGMLGNQYITGKYGALTTQAVKDFQKMIGISENGVANHETQLALHDYVVELSRQNPENWIVEE